jgi:uncharacterized protein YPO0396
MGLQNQVSGQDVTRQVTVEIQDLRSIHKDAPKDAHQQNIFDAWEKKTKQFHKDISDLCHPTPQKELSAQI